MEVRGGGGQNSLRRVYRLAKTVYLGESGVESGRVTETSCSALTLFSGCGDLERERGVEVKTELGVPGHW